MSLARFEENAKSLEQFAEEIRSSLSESNRSWWKVGELLEEACNVYTPSSPEITQLLKQVDLSKGTASKLRTIAKSERLQTHRSRFEHAPAWTVLYEVAKLTETQFHELCASVPETEQITVAKINAFRGKRQSKASDGISLYGISMAKAAASENDDWIEEFTAKLSELISEYPHLKLIDSGYFEKQDRQRSRSYDKAREKVIHAWARELVNRYLSMDKEWIEYRSSKRLKGAKRPRYRFYESKAEMIHWVASDPKGAIGDLGYGTFDEHEIESLIKETMTNGS